MPVSTHGKARSGVSGTTFGPSSSRAEKRPERLIKSRLKFQLIGHIYVPFQVQFRTLMKVFMFKVTTFRGWATDDQGNRIGANTSLGLVSGTNLFTSVLEGDRVALQHGAGKSWGESNWVMMGHVEGEGGAQTLAASLLNSPCCGDAIAAARKYDFGGLVFIINAHEGETKARLFGFVSDVASLLRRDSRWVA